MNILYIEHYAGSDEMGMEFRPFYMAREWVKLGHNVTVLAADFSHLRKKNPTIEKDFTTEVQEGVEFVFLKTKPYKRNGLYRIINMTGFVKKVKKHAKHIAQTYKPDVIIHSSTYPMDVYAAQAVKEHCGAPCFYEIHDLWPMSLTAMAPKVLPSWNPLIKYVQKAEDTCYRLDEGVVSILPGALRHIEERGFKKVNYHNVPNGVVLENMIEPAPISAELEQQFEKWKSQGKFVVLYAGGHARSNALDCFVQAADLVNSNVQLVLVGKGDQKEALMEMGKGKKNLTFLPPVDKKQVPSLLSYADALYLGAKNDPLYTYGVGMNKIFDYMLAAKPVINGVNSPGNPLDLSECAVKVEAENAKALAEGIETLCAMTKEEQLAMGQKGYDYVIRHHDYKVLSKRFIEALESGMQKG